MAALPFKSTLDVVSGGGAADVGVRHDNHIFCFIYQHQQRFALVADPIADALCAPADRLQTYRRSGMCVDDRSRWEEDCVC